jgi:hypothetical protein
MFSSSIKLTSLLPRIYRIERYVNIENKKDFKQAAWLPVFLVFVAVPSRIVFKYGRTNPW